MTSLPDFALETYLGTWEFTARHHMTASDAQSLTIGELIALAGEGALDTLLGTPLSYTEPNGAPDLRAAIAATTQTCAADQILCFAGAEEGLYAFYRTVMTPEDHAIVVTPNYQSAESVPMAIGAVTGVPLEADQGWTLDIDRVAAAIRPNTRVISINFPHNPTGKILERDRFDALVTLCRRHGIWLFSDEVYRGIEHDPARRLPLAADAYERGVSLGVMSKAYGLPGLRIGWIACQDRALLDALVRTKHYLSICNSAPSERLAVMALGAADAILARTRAIAATGLAATQAFLADFPDLFESYRPDGGVVIYPRYLGRDGVEAFAERLVQQAGIVVLPASIYRSALGPTPTDRFRIGFGRNHVPAGLEAMREQIAAMASA
jgi:aspartate/methionine/tyrosine aminotransferase